MKITTLSLQIKILEMLLASENKQLGADVIIPELESEFSVDYEKIKEATILLVDRGVVEVKSDNSLKITDPSDAKTKLETLRRYKRKAKQNLRELISNDTKEEHTETIGNLPGEKTGASSNLVNGGMGTTYRNEGVSGTKPAPQRYAPPQGPRINESITAEDYTNLELLNAFSKLEGILEKTKDEQKEVLTNIGKLLEKSIAINYPKGKVTLPSGTIVDLRNQEAFSGKTGRKLGGAAASTALNIGKTLVDPELKLLKDIHKQQTITNEILSSINFFSKKERKLQEREQTTKRITARQRREDAREKSNLGELAKLAFGGIGATALSAMEGIAKDTKDPVLGSISKIGGLLELLFKFKASKYIFRSVAPMLKGILRGASGKGGKLGLLGIGSLGMLGATTGDYGQEEENPLTSTGNLLYGAKGAAKVLGKKIPGLGIGAGVALGASRAQEGDYTGAGMEVGSGLLSTVPGLGTMASIGMDAAILKRDMERNSKMGESMKSARSLGLIEPENLSLSESGLNKIKEHEKFSPMPYWDYKQYSVGYGTYVSKEEAEQIRKRGGITEGEAKSRLLKRVKLSENEVKNNLRVPVTQEQFDSLVSFAYNVGEPKFKSSTMLRKLNSGDYVGAGKEFKRWKFAGGEVLQGLVNRRKEEAKPFLEHTALRGNTREEAKLLPSPENKIQPKASIDFGGGDSADSLVTLKNESIVKENRPTAPIVINNTNNNVSSNNSQGNDKSLGGISDIRRFSDSYTRSLYSDVRMSFKNSV